MAGIHHQRMTAELEGEFVVFLLGIGINKPWKLHKWLPVMLAVRPMFEELQADPESGFLGYTPLGLSNTGLVVLQYWRSAEHLITYARSKDHAHWPAVARFNKRVGYSNGDVGIWHETYRVAPGQYETLYGNMPPIGLGKVGRLVPASGHRDTAAGRLRLRDAQDGRQGGEAAAGTRR